jgi:hypothetical protein
LQDLASGKIGQEGGLLRRGLEEMAKGRIASLADRLKSSPKLFGALVVGGLCFGTVANGKDAKWIFHAVMWHLPGKASVEEEVDELLNSVFECAPKRCRLFLLEALAFKVSLLSH